MPVCGTGSRRRGTLAALIWGRSEAEWLMKLIRWLDEHFEEYLMIFCLVAVTAVMFLQVIIRKLPWIPALTWAEEFCRFAWVWSVFLSLPYTIGRGNMLRVTVLRDILPPGGRRILDIAVDITVIGAMAMLLYCAVPLVADRYLSGETSPAMRWPMWVMYSFMILGFGLGVFRGIQRLIRHCGEGAASADGASGEEE